MAEQRSKHWCFTVFVDSYDEAESLLQRARDKSEYLIFGREICPSTGRRHLQGYVAFKTRTKFSSCRNYIPGAHFERMRGSSAEAAEYCKKDGQYTEYGQLPSPTDAAGPFKSAISLAKEGKIDEVADVYPGIYLRYKRTLESMLKFSDTDLSRSCGYWLYGPPRCGKDYGVREFAKEKGERLFNKPLNKWWDGYRNEENVLLSDVDPDNSKWLAYFLKIWSDRYVFTGEVKGGSIRIRPKRIFVTSNFKLEECFSGENLKAIKHRFDVYDFSNQFDKVSLHVEKPVTRRVLACLQNYEVAETSQSGSSSVAGQLSNHGVESPPEVSSPPIFGSEAAFPADEEDFTSSPWWSSVRDLADAVLQSKDVCGNNA